MKTEWENMTALSELEDDQAALLGAFLKIEEKTENICSIFITLFDLTKENVKTNLNQLKKIDFPDLARSIVSLRDGMRWGMLEQLIKEIT